MKRVDVTGVVCPLSTLVVRQELSELAPGETLLVEGDSPPAERNLRRSCVKCGYAVATADDVDEGRFGLEITVPAAHPEA